MRRIERTGQFKRDYKREAKGQHRATLDANLIPVLMALANDSLRLRRLKSITPSRI